MTLNWLVQAIEQKAHSSWHDILFNACAVLDKKYIDYLSTQLWLPGDEKIFAAFSIPRKDVKFILYGESPYPRAESANGYAFWDGAVGDIWSEKGLSKAVNRATSLRNFLKMLVLAETGKLSIPNIHQAISLHWVQTIDQLFQNFLQHGFLLLNFNLSLSLMNKTQEAKAWQPFHGVLLQVLAKENSRPELILLGKIAERVLALPSAENFKLFRAEHPYNLSFIQNSQVIEFFRPFTLLAVRTREKPSFGAGI